MAMTREQAAAAVAACSRVIAMGQALYFAGGGAGTGVPTQRR